MRLWLRDEGHSRDELQDVVTSWGIRDRAPPMCNVDPELDRRRKKEEEREERGGGGNITILRSGALSQLVYTVDKSTLSPSLTMRHDFAGYFFSNLDLKSLRHSSN